MLDDNFILRSIKLYACTVSCKLTINSYWDFYNYYYYYLLLYIIIKMTCMCYGSFNNTQPWVETMHMLLSKQHIKMTCTCYGWIQQHTTMSGKYTYTLVRTTHSKMTCMCHGSFLGQTYHLPEPGEFSRLHHYRSSHTHSNLTVTSLPSTVCL